jgi:FtsP/CotA-like multicopper oxidase with cupredoxin domain
MRLSLIAALLLAGPLASQTPILANDNLRAAGALRRDVLTLHLVAGTGVWHPEAETGAGLVVQAFGEEGGPLTNPGPLIRVRSGTEIRVTVRNGISGATLVVHGLGPRPGAAGDLLVVPAGATQSARFRVGAPGTYFYWGTTTGVPLAKRRRADSQLSGALVVDSAGTPPDRTFLIGVWLDSVAIAGRREEREVPTINGKMFPYLPEFTFTVGDTVRWRWINASDRTHPMHLHGFYYRVDSRGDAVRDTVYEPPARRHVVTETLPSGATMAMTWVPERPGNWIFHCHVLFHITSDLTLEPTPPGAPRGGIERMVGLVLLLHVRGRAAGEPVAAPVAGRPARRLRLLVQSGPHRFPGRDSIGYGFVLQDGAREPAPDSIRIPGPPLVLTRGEPVEITVVNHLREPTAVHWHGIELESFYDGVPGMSGDPGRLMPSILPGDSFVVKFTPPRAGTFIYHSHLDDVHQLESGLYGPLLVLEPGQTYDPVTDHVLLISSYAEADSILWNGRGTADTLALATGVPQRLRLVVIPSAGDAEVALVRDTTRLTWTPLAKDGRDLPPGQRRARPSSAYVAVGETYDFAFTPEQPELLRFVIRDGGQIFFTAPVRVRQ